MFREIYRVLSPQGCLIIETPYTKNIVLGTYNFWLDPTHLRPVNVKLVKALGEYLGFVHFDFYPLQSIPLSELTEVRLLDAFRTTSPDVSMVLIKGESKGELLEQLINVTESLRQRATVDLEQIIDIYDLRGRERYEKLESMYQVLECLKVQMDLQSKTLQNLSNIANEALARANSVVTSQFWRSYDKLRRLRKFLIRKKKEFAERILRKSQKFTNLSAKEEPLSIEEETLKRRLEFLRRRLRD